MYAWTLIRTGDKVVHLGASVKRSDLGISREEWDALIEAGSVRKKEYPAPSYFQGSAIDFLKQQAREALGDEEELLAGEEEEVGEVS